VDGRVRNAQVCGDALDAHAVGTFVVKSPLRGIQDLEFSSLRRPTLSLDH
jgi:hypothetical protein